MVILQMPISKGKIPIKFGKLYVVLWGLHLVGFISSQNCRLNIPTELNEVDVYYGQWSWIRYLTSKTSLTSKKRAQLKFIVF